MHSNFQSPTHATMCDLFFVLSTVYYTHHWLTYTDQAAEALGWINNTLSQQHECWTANHACTVHAATSQDNTCLHSICMCICVYVYRFLPSRCCSAWPAEYHCPHAWHGRFTTLHFLLTPHCDWHMCQWVTGSPMTLKPIIAFILYSCVCVHVEVISHNTGTQPVPSVQMEWRTTMQFNECLVKESF